jgi:hypothetical protein
MITEKNSVEQFRVKGGVSGPQPAGIWAWN